VRRAGLGAWTKRGVETRLREVVGGPARLRVVVLLAAVLALEASDASTVAAVAPQLSQALSINNTQIGLLVTASTGVGAVATLPIGILVDRVARVRLLSVAIVIWSIATIVGGAATSYAMLLLARLALGAVVATAFPVVSSLTGDLFPGADRGRIWGYILSGELIGVAVGLGVSGTVAGLLSWRFSFWLLALPGLVLAVVLPRLLPEPARGGQSRLAPGAITIASAGQIAWRPPDRGRETAASAGAAPEKTTATPSDEIVGDVAHQGVAPHTDRVIHDDPARWSLGRAVRYVLSVRTNVALIIASGLGYFYLTGLRTFAVVYIRSRFGIGQSTASLLLVVIGAGAIAGVLLAGRGADRLVARGIITGRMLVAGTAFLIVVAFLLPGLLLGSLLLVGPLLFLGAAGLGGANPPLDAARLEIMHSRLWGRAESVRTLLRSALVASAPLLFGYVSVELGRDGAGAAGSTTADASGLASTFLLMLVAPLAAGLIILILARRSYPRDVATAVAAEQAPTRE